MCGIAGYWSRSGIHQDHLQEDLAYALKSLRHRGPDDEGIWSNECGVGLAHSRLSILDLSELGHQPMLSPDGRFTIVFNGEIYNFRQLRGELQSKGYVFQSDCDTEVILAAFYEWGCNCANRFIGMFALAIWDSQEERLSLCRDRVGVKPLYFGWDGDTLWFGSEMKALIAFRHFEPSIDMQSLGEYFQFGHISAPRSIFQRVQKLLPGHWLQLDRSEKEPAVMPYWSLTDLIPGDSHERPEEELAEELEELLISAFKYRMVSDVPVGIFLSGGIDSSIVAAILQRHSSSSVHTFTIGFSDEDCDESSWARMVAESIGSNHTEYILGLEKARELIPSLPKLYDEPFADSSGIPTYMVSKLAADSVKVVLSADGGDELFGGYNSYRFVPKRLNQIARKPAWLRRLAGTILSATPMPTLAKITTSVNLGRSDFHSRLLRKLIKLEALLPDASPADVFRVTQTHWMPKELEELLGSPYINPREDVNHFDGKFEEQMMLWDFHHYLPDDIMVKVDRATMAASIEGREPLLDHRLIEFAYQLPLKYRLGPLGPKHLLRKVLYKYVPKELIDRPKQGFAIPINQWMRANNGALAESLVDSASPITKVLSHKVVLREVSMLRKFGVNETRVWQLLMLENWLNEYGL